jgi:hypothetical protein
MTSDYWHGVNAALGGGIYDFKAFRKPYSTYQLKDPPVGNTHFSQSFIDGYMSVLRGEHFGWGQQEEYDRQSIKDYMNKKYKK